jgi:hypothetical protein
MEAVSQRNPSPNVPSVKAAREAKSAAERNRLAYWPRGSGLTSGAARATVPSSHVGARMRAAKSAPRAGSGRPRAYQPGANMTAATTTSARRERKKEPLMRRPSYNISVPRSGRLRPSELPTYQFRPSMTSLPSRPPRPAPDIPSAGADPDASWQKPVCGSPIYPLGGR